MPYNLKSSYISRDVPQYFDDILPDSIAWQADVYRLAAKLARESDVSRLVDIGCGRGEKLLTYADEFKLTGVDYGSNIQSLKEQFPQHTWLEFNLESAIIGALITLENSVVVCADVIEHLIDPTSLLETLRGATKTAKYVLISTPDRQRVHKKDHDGPPVNKYHVREWTLTELQGWFEQEGLPVKWAGWTISNDNRPEQRWTSLIILSAHETIEHMPITFQPAPQFRKSVRSSGGNRLKVWMTPTPSEAGRDTTNAIHQVVMRLDEKLPDYDIELVEESTNADLRVGHAGQGSADSIDVCHYHGLMNTAGGHSDRHFFAINSHVIANLRSAKIVTAPSEWIADVLRRDMHLSPEIVGWGVDVDEWQPVSDPGLYVLWNKARVDAVSDPAPMLQLAAQVPNMPFLTTFGEGGQNVKTIGRQPYEVMKNYVRNASVYLATVTETFGIATVEAMAAGVPVLGFRHGNTAHLVEHGVSGFLAEPGDIDGLREGLIYCMKYRDRLGANAREAAKYYTWDRVAQSMAAIYRRVLEPHQGVKVGVIIPCHNYEEYVAQAVESVDAQQTNFPYEVIVVLDRCTDHSKQAVTPYVKRGGNHAVQMISVDNGSLSATRNDGIKAATGEYIVCLDADDKLGSPFFLQTLSDALDKDRTLGIAFTGIRFMNAAGELGHKSTWPNGYNYDEMLVRHNQIPSCCMFRKDMWTRAGGFRPWFKYAEDAEFWTTALSLGYGAQFIDTDWFHYRLHAKSASQVHRTGEVKEPDWNEFHPFAKDGQRPFAAGGKPPFGSWPVRFYLKPDVTVIIPVGEGHEELVKDALHSVEGQTHRMWECIIVNDTNVELDLSGFPWTKVISNDGRMGAGTARNLGAKSANAPFLVFLDADDILKPRFLELALKTYTAKGRYAYCDWMTDDRRGNVEIHPVPEYSREAFWEHPSLHPVTALIPRAWFNAVGGFDESLPAFEDVDLYMKMLTHGYCGVRIPEPLLVYNLETGKRRKSGEKNRNQFLTLLKQRYGSFMEGKEMCNCVEPPKGKAPVPPTPDNAAEYREAYGEMVKVQLTWERQPESPVTFKGPGTNVFYGQRARNDIFYIWEADLTVGGEMFTKIEDYQPESVATVVPPPPPELNSKFSDEVTYGMGENGAVGGYEPVENAKVAVETVMDDAGVAMASKPASKRTAKPSSGRKKVGRRKAL